MSTTRTTARRSLLTYLRARPSDAGQTLIELIVAISLVGALVGIGVKMYHSTTIGRAEEQQRVAVQAGIDDAQGQLTRDLTDGISLRVADAQALSLTVVRDGLCQQRAYLADPVARTFSVTTSWYPTASCSGTPKVTPAKVLITRYDQATTFTYWGSSAVVPIPTPVSDTRNVTLVQWNFTAAPYVTRKAPEVVQGTSAVWRGLGDSSGTGVAALHVGAPTLHVVSHAPTSLPNGDAPVLTWAPAQPADLTAIAGWRVVRGAYPEGGDSSTAGAAWIGVFWVQDPSITTWTDISLAPGERGTYIVIPILTDGHDGTASNNADAGRRPAAPTDVTATGAPTSIAVGWTRSSGATGYDLYRDGTLVANVGDVASWTDVLTWGHSHNYVVVATNRWESVLTTGSQNLRVPLGDSLTKTYADPVDGAAVPRLASASASAWTAPAVPTLSVTAGDRVSSLSWTPAAWVGAGPVPATTWTVAYRSSSEASATVATTAATSWTHSARPAGRWSEYAVTGSTTSGAGPASAWSRAWQRPATPTCSVSGITTRSMVATASALAATADEAYSTYQVAIGTDGWTNNGWTFDPLTDATAYGFRVQVQGNGGWSDAGACSGTTATLVAVAPTCAISGGGDVPAAVTISAAGGTGTRQVRLGSSGAWYTAPEAYTLSSAGTYYGYARTYASDGYNSAVSGTIGCAGSAVVTNPYPSAWGVAAGCPGVAIYVTSTDPWAYNVRKTGVDTCQARAIVTAAGADLGTMGLAGDVIGYYSWTFSVGGPAWTRTWGTIPNASLPAA